MASVSVKWNSTVSLKIIALMLCLCYFLLAATFVSTHEKHTTVTWLENAVSIVLYCTLLLCVLDLVISPVVVAKNRIRYHWLVSILELAISLMFSVACAMVGYASHQLTKIRAKAGNEEAHGTHHGLQTEDFFVYKYRFLGSLMLLIAAGLSFVATFRRCEDIGNFQSKNRVKNKQRMDEEDDYYDDADNADEARGSNACVKIPLRDIARHVAWVVPADMAQEGNVASSPSNGRKDYIGWILPEQSSSSNPGVPQTKPSQVFGENVDFLRPAHMKCNPPPYGVTRMYEIETDSD